MKNTSCLIIGLGAMGGAALYHLAKMRVNPVGLEQFRIGHGLGSSHGHTRAFRTFYDKPVYTDLALAAIPLWRDLESETGADLLYQTGMLFYAPPDHAGLIHNMKVMDTCGGNYETLTSDEVQRRFNALHIPPDHLACLTPDSGFLHAELVIQKQAEQALNYGAEVVNDSEVIGIDLTNDKPVVETAREKYQCEHLIITAGPWTSRLLADLKIPLKVTRQQKFYFKPDEHDLYLPERMPVFADYSSDCYGFPYFGPGVKTADDMLGPVTDPGHVNRDPDRNTQSALKGWLEKVMPDTGWASGESATCLYTLSPDRDFIIDHHPDNERVVIAAAFSGHGFKFTPLIGRILADLTTTGKTDYPIDTFRLARFK